MRRLAGLAVFLLVAALISPAFAQPFADTPTNHWAYDAIAELAAKGLIEGYPDGTFKGDRAMTRYEMAMVVARLLARIESIQIPTPAPPPKPEVTKADIDKILRLVNEFRAELAAKNVRLTAIEEELNAIKAKLDNVRITGALRIRYDERRLSSGPAIPGNGNPRAKATDASTTSLENLFRQVFKLSFDGSVSPSVHFIAAIQTPDFFVANSGNFGFGVTNNCGSAAGTSCLSQGAFGSIDNAFFDWRNAFGWPLEFWLGRFGGGGKGGQTIGTVYPVQFGPFGLLMNTGSKPWEDSTGDSGHNVVDGLRAAAHVASLADLQVQGMIARVIGNIGSLSYPSGEDAWGVDANVRVIPGLRIGGYYVGNTIGQNGSAPFTQPAGALSVFYHVYGPGGSAHGPATANCPAVPASALTTGGITCPALGNGYGAYVDWIIIPGITFDGEWAQWNDNVLGGQDTGFNAVVTWNLGRLLGVGHGLFLTTGYQYYGVNFYPPYGGPVLDPFGDRQLYPGNGQGFTAGVSAVLFGPLSVYFTYFTGNNVSNSQPLQEYEGGFRYRLAPNASVKTLIREMRINGIEQDLLYRAQLDYTF